MKLSEVWDLVKEQQETLKGLEDGIKRDSLETLPDLKSHALVISGVRRCGKSTLLRQFIRKLSRSFVYINFDDIRFALWTIQDYQLLDKVIKESAPSLLFFDEIQSAPDWELYVRQKIDEGFQVLITGSNARLLSRELGTRLTGRNILRELFPFSYSEYLRFKNLNAGAASLETYLEDGGFPEYLKSGNGEILSQLQTDIIYRDIAGRYNLRDAGPLLSLYSILVSSAGQLVSPSRLAPAICVKSATTVLEYFSYFQNAYLISLVPCFAWSAKKRTLAPKKLYICDTGLIRTGALNFSANHGAIFENFVFSQLRLNNKDIFYYKGKTGECDFVVRNKGGFVCIQACWELSDENQDREINGLFEAMAFFSVTQGTILTKDQRDIILKNGREITVVPAWEYFTLR